MTIIPGLSPGSDCLLFTPMKGSAGLALTLKKRCRNDGSTVFTVRVSPAEKLFSMSCHGYKAGKCRKGDVWHFRRQDVVGGSVAERRVGCRDEERLVRIGKSRSYRGSGKLSREDEECRKREGRAAERGSRARVVEGRGWSRRGRDSVVDRPRCRAEQKSRRRRRSG